MSTPSATRLFTRASKYCLDFLSVGSIVYFSRNSNDSGNCSFKTFTKFSSGSSTMVAAAPKRTPAPVNRAAFLAFLFECSLQSHRLMNP